MQKQHRQKKILAAVVLTGDVVASAAMEPAARRKLIGYIERFFDRFGKEFPDLNWQQYRGDSLQAILTTNRAYALKLALQLQCLLMANNFFIRLALGIGNINYHGKDVTTSDGTAFQASGPMIDLMKTTNKLIGINAADTAFDAEWQVHGDALNYLLQRLSPAQAEAMALFLQNVKQEDIARKLKISQPSVHQRLQAAGAPVFQSILKRFESSVLLF